MRRYRQSVEVRCLIDYDPREGYKWTADGSIGSGFLAAEDACDAAYAAVWPVVKKGGTMAYRYSDAARARMHETGEDRE